MAPAPSVTVQLPAGDRTVVFDLARLEAIELATGRTVNDIAFGELASYAAAGEQGAPPTNEQSLAAARRVSVRFIVPFLAGCLDIKPGELQTVVPFGLVMATFQSVSLAFMQAAAQLNGGGAAEGGAEANPPELPADASGS
jgi:hypothetical protein